MKCNNCGTNLGESDAFCPSCGTPVQRTNNVNNEGNYTYERGVNQQMNYNQQQGQYQQNYGQPYQKSKNAGDIVKICVGTLIGLAILVAIIFVIYSVTSALNKNNDTNIDNPGTSTSIDNNSGVTPVSNNKSSSYKVNFNGFKLYIPDNLMYEMDYTNDAIVIGDADQTWVAQLLIKQGSFQQIKKNKNQLNSLLTEEFGGYNAKVSNAVIETVGGVEYVLLESEVSGTSMIVGYAGLNSMYTACFTLMNEDNDFNRDMLKDLSKIISNAEYSGDSSYMKSNEGIKATDLNKAFDKILKTEDAE